ncbi:uncharacterized protein LOC132696025 [Cylas formicarius]|uniref:uncharacterized protein LOC132696025 n=1 Tax=Cylas formicarius TaxID=197179 RepID=UPI002958CE78|nr:uncharacterized protein LOC132696025 [Cylas formicarius]
MLFLEKKVFLANTVPLNLERILKYLFVMLNMMESILDDIISLHKAKKWEAILKLRNEHCDHLSALKILWVWPSTTNLTFLKNVMWNYNMKGVISLGCGCGLLEWIIEQATGYPAIGYEINEEWWESKYSNPQFIPLKYAEKEKPVLHSAYALLFCYFNDGSAFRDYIKSYKGRMVIIIGPGEGSGRHADPLPFSAEFGESNWKIFQHQEVRDTKDFIAIYLRK